MRKDPDFTFTGQSGSYRMSAAGRLERQPAWGEFSEGRPVPLEPPARPIAAPLDTGIPVAR